MNVNDYGNTTLEKRNVSPATSQYASPSETIAHQRLLSVLILNVSLAQDDDTSSILEPDVVITLWIGDTEVMPRLSTN